MLGRLPVSLTVNGKEYKIDSDYRNALAILTAFSAEDLNDREKALVCVRRLFPDWQSIPKEDLDGCYKAAVDFLENGFHSDHPSPRLINWDKDEQLIFPEINKVAGTEVRALPYMHWWTFLGYFQAVDREGLWGSVLLIRQKKARGKKLEKHEKEFYKANKDLITLEKPKKTDYNGSAGERALLAAFDDLAGGD